MPTPRADAYEKALTILFQPDGYGRVAPRTYAHSDDNIVWRALRVTFHNKGSLCVQPFLSVYCPSASKIVDRGLEATSDNTYKRDRSKFGRPILVHPLYDRVYRHHDEDRHSYSYDAESIEKIDASARLVYSDFLKAADSFFGHIRSLSDLRDEIKATPFGTGAGMYAMALGYLIDPDISLQEIDVCVRLSPNPMTEKFAGYFKTEIGLANAN
jgi:hypothetical protein